MDKPTYEELVALLKAAPPRQQIPDDRYWAWRRKVEQLEERLGE